MGSQTSEVSTDFRGTWTFALKIKSAVIIYICIYGIWQTDLSRTTYINASKVSVKYCFTKTLAKTKAPSVFSVGR